MIETEDPLLRLRNIQHGDAEAIYHLIQSSQEHLTRLGDYKDMVAMSLEDHRSQLESPDENEETFVILLASELIGTVSVIRHGPGVFGLGYWIGQTFANKGLMTTAVKAILRLLVDERGAQEIWAGINPHNEPSIKLVEGLSFTLAREQPTHLSYVYR